MQETWIRSLSQETLLEKEMATHSNILAWGIPWTEEPGGLQPLGLEESDTNSQLNHHHHSRAQESQNSGMQMKCSNLMKMYVDNVDQ